MLNQIVSYDQMETLTRQLNPDKSRNNPKDILYYIYIYN